MSNVASADKVRELREMTGAGFMDCKQALLETSGDLEQAKDALRKKGLAAAGKRASREAKDGLIFVVSDGRRGALLELNCETDFVAKTDDFQKLGERLLAKVLEKGEAAIQGGDTETQIQEVSGKIGEKIAVRRAVKYEAKSGLVACYRHHNFKIGILIEFEFSKLELAQNPDVLKTAKDLAMQAAALRPQFLAPGEIDSAFLEREKAIFREQIKDKPAQVQEKILAGKLEKRYEEICLLNQKSIVDNTKSVQDIVKALSQKVGETITIKRFSRFEIGFE